MTIKTNTFDAARYLETDEDIRIYLEEAASENDPDSFLNALKTAMRAKGVDKVAGLSGLTTNSLYKFPGERTQFTTVSKLCAAFGVKWTVHA